MIIGKCFEIEKYNMSVMIPKRITGYFERGYLKLNDDIDSVEIIGDVSLDGYKYDYIWKLCRFSEYNIHNVNDITEEMLLEHLSNTMKEGSVVSFLTIKGEYHRYLLNTCKPFCDKYKLHPKLFKVPKSIIFQRNMRQNLYYEKIKIERNIDLTDHIETYETRDGQRVVTFNPYFLNRDYEKLYESGFFAPLQDAGCEVKILDSSYVTKSDVQGDCIAIYLPKHVPSISFFRYGRKNFTKSDVEFLNINKFGITIK